MTAATERGITGVEVARQYGDPARASVQRSAM